MSDLNILSPYDYDIFDDQVFLRHTMGMWFGLLTTELSRGCIYSCSYCVETVIQNIMGLRKTHQKLGL